MYARKENIDTLVGFGLSGTQARICLALAAAGISTIREISEVSGVARPDTYRAVVELEKKGLIEKTVSAPTRYTLLSLHDVLSVLVGRRETESLELQNRSVSLLEEYEKKLTESRLANESQFVLVPSGKAFSNRLRKSIENSKKSICVITYQKTLTQFLDCMLGMLKRAIGKEVNVRILTEKRRNNSLAKRLFSLQKKAHFENRFLNILPPFSLITFDEREILLSTKSQSENASAPAVYSNNSSLAELSQSYFNDAWFSAVEPPGLAFKRTKLQFDNLFTNMIDGFAYCKMIFDDESKPVDFVYLQINDAFERITGLTRAQVIGKRATRVRPGIEKTNPELFQIYGRVSRSGKAEEMEVSYKPLNCWRRISVYSPKRGYFALVFEDITERKKAEKDLFEKQQELNLIFDSSPILIFFKDREGKFKQVNRAFAQALKMPKEKLLSKTVFDIYSAEIAEGLTDEDAEVLESKLPKLGIIGSYPSPTGLRWVRTDKIPTLDENGAVDGLIGFSEDITERKKAEDELKKRYDFLESLGENVNAGLAIVDRNYKLVWANKMLKDVGACPGKQCYETLAHANMVCSDCGAKKIFDQNVLLDVHEYQHIRPDGEAYWVELRVTPLKDENGNTTAALELAVPINERKKAEVSLRESEERLRLAQSSAHVGIWDWNLLSGKVEWTEELEKMYGYEPGTFPRSYEAFQKRVYPEDIAKVEALRDEAVKLHEAFDFDFRVKLPSGEIRWVNCKGGAIYDEEEKPQRVFGVNVDITERKKAEAERQLMIEFLRIANVTTSTRDLIKASANLFQKQSGCEAVGIRLKKGDDYPYYETRGFPPEHVRLENRLCAKDEAGCPIRDFKGDPVLECMCGNIICGRFDPSKRFFTAKGSFWTNSTSELLADTTEEDRQARTRNRCNGEGYESVALLALRVGNDRLGLVQLNDKRKNIFTLETIQTWERIADHLALALSKTISKESLEKCERERTKSEQQRLAQA